MQCQFKKLKRQFKTVFIPGPSQMNQTGQMRHLGYYSSMHLSAHVPQDDAVEFRFCKK